MTTAAQKLAQYGVTMEQAHAFLLANAVANPSLVLSVAVTAGLTNAMLGEIAGYPGAAYSAANVSAYFGLFGLNSAVLDPAPTVVSVSSAQGNEGGPLLHYVALSAPTTAAIDISLGLQFDSFSLADLSGYAISNGVTLGANFTTLHVPAGVSTFTIGFTTASDSLPEVTEHYSITVGGITATGALIDDDLPPDVGVTVSSVTTGSATEGGEIVHHVTLSGPAVSPNGIDSTMPMYISLANTTTSANDFNGFLFTNAVSISEDKIYIPVGVTSFDVRVLTVNDTTDEPNETYILSVGNVQASGTIVDNDEPAPPTPPGSSILPTILDGFTPVLSLNEHTGALSSLSLRTEILKTAQVANYWALFDPVKYDGTGDGVLTPAELGIDLGVGNLPATKETIESLFYGTFIDVALAIDFQEAGPIGSFFINNLVGITQRNPAIVSQYVNLFVEAAADPAPAGMQVHPEGALANQMIVGMINSATHTGLGANINIFDALLSI